MTHPHYATCAEFLTTEIIENEQIARDTMRLRLEVPDKTLGSAPGQFFMIRDPGNDPLIGRAFAIYDASLDGTSQNWIDLVYVVKGKLTTTIANRRTGDSISWWGPLGNSFRTDPVDHLILVAGGIGQTPFLLLCQEALGVRKFGDRPNGYAKRVSFCYGARSADYLAGLDAFRSTGAELLIATDDGSHGPPRRVTNALEDCLAASSSAESKRIVCCGPEPMMEATSTIAATNGISCDVSLETPMACGIGICFSCVAKVGTESDWDYKRTCVEGPIFDAAEIVW